MNTDKPKYIDNEREPGLQTYIRNAKPTQTASAPETRTVASEWATAKELLAMRPAFYDLNTIAITKDGSTWHFCGTDKWFRTSGAPKP